MNSDKIQWDQIILKFEISGVESPEGIMVIDLQGTRIRSLKFEISED